MNLRWAFLFLLASAGSVRGQQIAQYSQYVFNQFSINPAVAGSKDCLDMRLGYRQQWVGYPGAPTTGWMSMHGSLRPKGKPFQANKHGIGAFIEADDAGNFGYTSFLLAYAYHIQMSRNFFLSMGVFAGARQVKLAVGDITLGNYNDPVVNSKSSALVYPEVTPGIWMYGKKGWAGLSIQQILGNKMKDVGVDSRLVRHIMASGGYKYRIGRKTAFIPSALIKFAGGAPIAFDINAMVEWNRTYGLGLGYRNGDALVAMIKIGFLQYFQFGYSYDITTSRLRVASSNTHEVILAITPCKKESVGKRMISCPAFD
ncbi:MAG: type IX secretion system membrane protein PorP/SprF [Flavobacteriales bacterium]|jgi:type IX secretion system PorP/SprF family membrane protein|nr:type IX secretion system membrane protein PorP/SprF [Flavobacteriales bacterium]MBK6550132.1 type IX secretion system membrane protein PorP/SprF [Flavobacteriales bacterium]MBK6881707.1 type IX secretion system membrane protein PorP/SprF [Flavobacteriales bacterium]MBK7102642.1 type IX secretion system membrane protein PorP/SprF [Flavobacteriales bacterium]MBK7113376.1 type IX secretion system membrane protein PorP/SprF [Flavobacteriales bacterium]